MADVIPQLLGLLFTIGAGLFFLVFRQIFKGLDGVKLSVQQQGETLKTEIKKDTSRIEQHVSHLLETIQSHEVRITVIEKLSERKGSHVERGN